MNATTPAAHGSGATVVLVVVARVGDCDSGGSLTVDELLTMVDIAAGVFDVTSCDAGDADGDSQIAVDEILAAVDNALNGCGVSAAR